MFGFLFVNFEIKPIWLTFGDKSSSAAPFEELQSLQKRFPETFS
jgi:hypothetical protein